MQNKVFPFAQVIEAICSLAAFWYLRKQQGYWRGFMLFLPFTLIVEIIGRLIPTLLHQSNHWLYNIYLPVQFMFTGYVLYRAFPYNGKTPWFVIGLLLFVIIYITESVIRNYSYNTISDTFSSFLLVCACGFYYFFLLKSETYIALSDYAPFWFVSGVFLFNFGITASNLFANELMNLYIIQKVSLRYIIFLTLTFILYSCWMYAFRCKNQEKILS